MKNAAGLAFTGQAGPWNVFNTDPWGYGNLTYGGAGPSGPLANGAGTATGVRFAITASYRCAPGNSSLIGYLRNEATALYDTGGLSANPVTWEITGLVPNGAYQLAFFSGSGGTYAANGVPAVRDSEGDANWSNLPADSTGKISGSLAALQAGQGEYVAMYGFQLEHIPKTQPPAVAPSAPLPTDGATNVATSTSLDWSDCLGAESYDVSLWPTTGSPPMGSSATVTVSKYAPPRFLLPLTNYSWQVTARNPIGATNGPVWTFTTDDGRPLAPATPSPADGATNVLVDTVLDWGDSLRASGYQVYVWLDGAGRPATPATKVALSAYLPPLPLTGNTTYNWQIVATNQYGSTTGAVWTFTTGDRYPGYLVLWPKSVIMRSGDFLLTTNRWWRSMPTGPRLVRSGVSRQGPPRCRSPTLLTGRSCAIQWCWWTVRTTASRYKSLRCPQMRRSRLPRMALVFAAWLTCSLEPTR